MRDSILACTYVISSNITKNKLSKFSRRYSHERKIRSVLHVCS